MELISIGNLEVENILVLVAIERNLDHELTQCIIKQPCLCLFLTENI